MASIKFFSGLLILYLLQFCFAKPSKFPDSSEDLHISAKDSLMLYAGLNFLDMIYNYVHESINISRAILEDKDLLSNGKPEVLGFKNILTSYLKVYDFTEDMEDEEISLTIETFADTIAHYSTLSSEERTPESDFIVKILTKYKIEEIETKLLEEFEEFIVNFQILFEKAREELDKSMLDWYDKFESLTDFEEKLIFFNEFDEFMRNEIPS